MGLPKNTWKEGRNMEKDTELEDDLLGTAHEDELPDGADNPDKESDPKAYTDEDVDEIVQKKITRLEKKHQRELDRVKNELQQDDLSEVDKLRQRLEEYELSETRRERERDVRHLFTEAGVPASDGVIASLIRDDEEATLDAAEAVLELVQQERQALKKQQGRRTPPLDPNGSATKESTPASLRDFANSVRVIKD